MVDLKIFSVNVFIVWNNTPHRATDEQVHVSRNYLIRAESQEQACEYAKAQLKKEVSEAWIGAFTDNIAIQDIPKDFVMESV